MHAITEESSNSSKDISRLSRRTNDLRAARLYVVGLVQGVGFRPFVYRIARASGVRGYVRNLGGSGVEIFVEGTGQNVNDFLHRFTAEKPIQAIVEKLEIREAEPEGHDVFKILSSDPDHTKHSIIPPDFSICESCLNEVLTPTRWQNYAFTSCAYCGPRYSMMSRLPYDRSNTSMVDFPMCDECFREFSDVDDVRRFHAQGISCPRCGPAVRLLTSDFSELSVGYKAIADSAKLINDGLIVAVKGVGGFHIAASATRDDVLRLLRSRKRRPTKPFAVMALDIQTVEQLCWLDAQARGILQSVQRPILLAERKSSPLSELVAPGLKHLGVFLPYTALHYLLLRETSDKFAVMTSGNPPNEPMCISDDDARERLSAFVDYFLIHNRRIVNRVDDSVVRISGGRALLLRRGRGYAPMWVSLLSKSERPVIAFGAMLQNAGCILFEDKAVVTSYVGDVDEYRTLLDLEKSLRFFIDCYRVDLSSAVVACDLHPSYPSTNLAEVWAGKHEVGLVKVQHHWAHIASAMAEHGLDGEVVGIAVDGVGLGDDGMVWGGEVLRASYERYERVGCLKPQLMPGGDAAVEYPARMLLGFLLGSRTEEEVSELMRRLDLDTRGFPRGRREMELILRNASRHSVYTSSAGRFYDAVSALLGICLRRTYEGEPAIMLEASTTPTDMRLEVRISGSGPYWVDTNKILEDIIALLEDGVDRRKIAFLAQHAVGYGLGTIARHVAGGCGELVVSGGAAVNEYFLQGLNEALEGGSLTVYLPAKLPANDGGIALGQAVIAARQNNFRSPSPDTKQLG